MTEHGILFTGPMVCRILQGLKTQTRRVINPQPLVDELGREEYGKIIGPGMFEPVAYDRHGEMFPGPETYGAFDDSGAWGVKSPHGKPGDRLWVRENTYIDDAGVSDIKGFLDTYHVNYKADGHSAWCYSPVHLKNIGNKPSIHMSRWMCRLLLDVVDVRVERLQDISEEDAVAEGALRFDDIPPGPVFGKTTDRWSMESPENSEQCLGTARWAFANYWEKLNSKRGFGWNDNPWVWVNEFSPVSEQQSADARQHTTDYDN